MKSVRLINHNFHKVCDIKAFLEKKNKKQANQTAFAGSEKKIIQEWVQRHFAHCPLTLRRDKET